MKPSRPSPSRPLGRRPLLAGVVLAWAALCGAGCATTSHPAAPLPVQAFPEEVVVTAWTEPSRLPSGGGDAQVLVRVKRKSGGLVPGVEVRLRSTAGTLYSQGRVLITDARGMTRDRLTTRETAFLTVNAGGTPFTLRVEVPGGKD